MPHLALALALALPAFPAARQDRAGEVVSVHSFELSGCAPVAGGLLVVDDELVGAVLFVADAAAGKRSARIVKVEAARKASEPFTAMPRLLAVQDFEGAASDGRSAVFLLGSHEGKDGDRRPDREFLIEARWRPEAGELERLRVWRGLVDALAGTEVAELVDAPEDLCAEGLAVHDGRLFVGLRAPLAADGRALVLSATVAEVFAAGDEPVRLAVHRLDLSGLGIRGLEWDPIAGALLVLSGPSGDGPRRADLWHWDPSEPARPCRSLHAFTADELAADGRPAAPEGVARIDERTVIVVLDGGAGGAPRIRTVTIR